VTSIIIFRMSDLGYHANKNCLQKGILIIREDFFRKLILNSQALKQM